MNRITTCLIVAACLIAAACSHTTQNIAHQNTIAQTSQTQAQSQAQAQTQASQATAQAQRQRQLKQSLLAGGSATNRENPNIPPTPRGYRNIIILAPFKGHNANIGQSILNAAAMALFEHPDKRINLVNIDTHNGIMSALQNIPEHKPIAVIGPVFAQETIQAQNPNTPGTLGQYNIPVFSLSNSNAIANNNVFPMGFSPEYQISMALKYLQEIKKQNVAIIAPDNPYGRIVAKIARQYSQANPAVRIKQVLFYPAETENFKTLISRIDPGINAIMPAPVKEQNLKIITSQLDSRNLAAPYIQIIGLQLWDNFSDLQKEPSLNRALWVSAEGELWRRFNRQYQDIFNEEPHKFASIAYDVMNIVLVGGGGGKLSEGNIRGINGNFRLKPNGEVHRDYFLKQIKNNTIGLVR